MLWFFKQIIRAYFLNRGERMSQTKDKRPEKKQTEGHPIKEAFQSSVAEVKHKAGETGKEIVRETETRARRLFSEQLRLASSLIGLGTVELTFSEIYQP